MTKDTPSDRNPDKLDPRRNPVDAQRAQTRDKVEKTWGDRFHSGADFLGKVGERTSQILATTVGHIGAALGHGAGGTKKAVRRGWRAYKSHDDVDASRN